MGPKILLGSGCRANAISHALGEVEHERNSSGVESLKGLIIPVVMLIAATSVQGSDLSKGQEAQTLFLEVYLESTGMALVVGYVEPQTLSNLSFIEGSEYIYEEETGQLYAMTDSLGRDGVWADLSLEGTYSLCQVTFYMPDGEAVEVEASAGLDRYIYSAEEGCEVQVCGYSVRDPAVTIRPLPSGTEE